MAASLGLCHETSYAYSYPASNTSSSLCFPPLMADHIVDGGGGGGCSFGEFLELGHSVYSLPLPPPPSQPVVVAGGNNDQYGVSSSSSAAATTSRIGFRTRSEVEVLDDGFKWRKYGKKAVKSSPNPRNYYRCSAAGCGVKKRVERDGDDPRYVVTTYDGVHNHATPGCVGGGGHLPYPTSAAPPWSVPAAAASPPPAHAQAWGAPLHAAAAAHSSESSF
ncbi:probable WRKY transcription factor 50 [Oryza sativa Japonica Group]|uniref:Os01g0186000 protein n=4 Tax=Oryza sativa subsp. japonica TaxID=39947 RepID=A0A8J8Y4C2_ORYSJ|eukprot:NP_001042243.1 Os01g0186000 [Oryza sativa Japonica Group]